MFVCLNWHRAQQQKNEIHFCRKKNKNRDVLPEITSVFLELTEDQTVCLIQLILDSVRTISETSSCCRQHKPNLQRATGRWAVKQASKSSSSTGPLGLDETRQQVLCRSLRGLKCFPQ